MLFKHTYNAQLFFVLQAKKIFINKMLGIASILKAEGSLFLYFGKEKKHSIAARAVQQTHLHSQNQN